MKIHKGDQVIVISGKDRGKKSKVLKTLPKEEYVFIEGVNMRKKHTRPKKMGEKGQIVEMPGSVHISNVKIICPKCGKATRTGYKAVDKKKFRICKKCGQEI